MKKLLTLTLLAAITLMTVSCGDKEEDFSCTSNTQFLVDGSREACGTTILNSYSAYREFNNESYPEYFKIGFTYSIGAGSTPGSISLTPESEVKEGESYTYTSDISPHDQELGLSVGLSLVEGIYITHYYGSLEVLKLDRDQNLITFSFELTQELNNGNSYNLTGTVTDFYFE